eukprot:COSAG01_NODE_16038_length_1275_cov_15.120748_1_plen_84_part_10
MIPLFSKSNIDVSPIFGCVPALDQISKTEATDAQKQQHHAYDGDRIEYMCFCVQLFLCRVLVLNLVLVAVQTKQQTAQSQRGAY